MMPRPGLCSILAIGMAALSWAQARPTFEVASFKPNNGPAFLDSSWGYPPGRFLVRNMSMRWIIAMAYGEPR